MLGILNCLFPKCVCHHTSRHWSRPFQGVIEQRPHLSGPYVRCLLHGTQRLYDLDEMRVVSVIEQAMLLRRYSPGKKVIYDGFVTSLHTCDRKHQRMAGLSVPRPVATTRVALVWKETARLTAGD